LGEHVSHSHLERTQEIAVGAGCGSIGGARIVWRQNRDPANGRRKRRNDCWRATDRSEQHTDKSDPNNKRYAHIVFPFFLKE
jgi:hypothetical protein